MSFPYTGHLWHKDSEKRPWMRRFVIVKDGVIRMYGTRSDYAQQKESIAALELIPNTKFLIGSDKVCHIGWMTKKGVIFWNLRWCILLRTGYLSYVDAEGKHEVRSIDLLNATITQQLEPELQLNIKDATGGIFQFRLDKTDFREWHTKITEVQKECARLRKEYSGGNDAALFPFMLIKEYENNNNNNNNNKSKDTRTQSSFDNRVCHYFCCDKEDELYAWQQALEANMRYGKNKKKPKARGSKSGKTPKAGSSGGDSKSQDDIGDNSDYDDISFATSDDKIEKEIRRLVKDLRLPQDAAASVLDLPKAQKIKMINAENLKRRSDSIAEPHFHSKRTAEFGGKICWKTLDKHTEKIEHNENTYKFELQTTRFYAIIEKSIYKHWRVVMKKGGKYRLTGRVIDEFDAKKEGIKFLQKVKRAFEIGFDETVDENEDPDIMREVLNDGDIISVPSFMGRHFGVYYEKRNMVIEYQSPPGNLIANGFTKGVIKETPFNEFCQRSKKDGKRMDLRKHIFNKENYVGTIFNDEEVVKRAYSMIGHGGYHAATKNCETFAMWCKTGNAQSMQSLKNSEAFIDGAIKVCALVVAGATIYFSVVAICAATAASAAAASAAGAASGAEAAAVGTEVAAPALAVASGVPIVPIKWGVFCFGLAKLGAAATCGRAAVIHNAIDKKGSQESTFE